MKKGAAMMPLPRYRTGYGPVPDYFLRFEPW
jgi:hypothetical protein